MLNLTRPLLDLRLSRLTPECCEEREGEGEGEATDTRGGEGQGEGAGECKGVW